jgi:hypothetical protein
VVTVFPSLPPPALSSPSPSPSPSSPFTHQMFQ